jgi:hypothetical protein
MGLAAGSPTPLSEFSKRFPTLRHGTLMTLVQAAATFFGQLGETGVKLGPLPTTLNVPAGLAYVGSTLYVVDEVENSVLSISGVF